MKFYGTIVADDDIVTKKYVDEKVTQGGGNVFVATYGVTAFADISAAYQAGKACIVNVPPNTTDVPGGVYVLAEYSETNIRFSQIVRETYTVTLYYIRCYNNDIWSVDAPDAGFTTELVIKDEDVFSIEENTANDALLSNFISDYDVRGIPVIRVWLESGGNGDTVVCSVRREASTVSTNYNVLYLYGVHNGNLITYKITNVDPYPSLAWEKTVTPISPPVIQTQGAWKYRVNADGTFEAWYTATKQSLTITATSGNLYRSDLQTITLPTQMTDGKTCDIQHVSINCAHNNYPTWGMLASVQTPTANTFKYYAMSGGSRSASPNYLVTAYVFGTLT